MPVVAVLAMPGCDRGSVIDAPGDGPGGCPHLEAEGFVLRLADSTLAWQWGEALHGAVAVGAGARLDDLGMTFLEPDSTGFQPAPACTALYTLACHVADTTIAEVRVRAGGFWRVDIVGLRDGTTTVTFRPRHLEHSHFLSLPVPVVVGSGVSAAPAPASGVVFRDGASPVAGFNPGLPFAAGEVFGVFVSEVGAVSHAFQAVFLDSTGAEMGPDPGVTVVYEVADTAIAQAMAEAGDGTRFRIAGPPTWPLVTSPETALRVKLVRDGVTGFVSAPIPVVLDDAGRIMASVDFQLDRHGAPALRVVSGEIIPAGQPAPGCPAAIAPADTLVAGSGVPGDEYLFREFLSCAPFDPDPGDHALVIESGIPDRIEVTRDFAAPGGALRFRLRGQTAGEVATIRMWLVHGAAHVIWETPPIPVVVR